MKRNDLIFACLIACIFVPFMVSDELLSFYLGFNSRHGMLMSFIKFSILATLGEVIALRISKGVYNEAGFGIAPRMVVWGFLGIAINIAFQVFGNGTPAFLAYMGIEQAPAAMSGGFSAIKLLDAFAISVSMNLVFAPVMMTFHKITDLHILSTGGTMRGFLTPVRFAEILHKIDWDVMWNFVFRKTIPLFWIPAHTITFLLPGGMRVLFAALLGMALGLILAYAGLRKNTKT